MSEKPTQPEAAPAPSAELDAAAAEKLAKREAKKAAKAAKIAAAKAKKEAREAAQKAKAAAKAANGGDDDDSTLIIRRFCVFCKKEFECFNHSFSILGSIFKKFPVLFLFVLSCYGKLKFYNFELL